MKVCIVGASGKLGRYMVQHALDRGYEVVGVRREKSVHKLDDFKGPGELSSQWVSALIRIAQRPSSAHAFAQ
jgi:uncharacterized protein YbjT (DUF2867 family)